MRVEKLYGGEVEIHFDPVLHRYKRAGERTYLISATAATGVIDKSQALVPWAVNLMGDYLVEYVLSEGSGQLDRDTLVQKIAESKKQHTQKKDDAANTGSKVHAWIEEFIDHKLNDAPCPSVPTEEAVMRGVSAFVDWYMENEVEFEESERLVYSRTYEYVGLADFVARVNGRRVVGDWKTGKRVYPEYLLQLSAYWSAIEEEDDRLLDGGMILHCDKETGEFNVTEVQMSEKPDHFDAFLAALRIKKWQKLHS